MIFKLSSIVSLLASVIFITYVDAAIVPQNFIWPLDGNNTCFAATFSLTINFRYKTDTNENKTTSLSLNETTYQSHSATCHEPDNIHQLTISMLNAYTVIVFKFYVNDTNATSLTDVYGYFYIDNTTVTPAPYSNLTHKFSSNQTLFQSQRSKTFRCNTKTKIEHILDNVNITITSIDLENLRVQSFIDTPTFEGFADEEDVCEADLEKDSNLIPIVVGACLAALIVVVLVAYLIGRRRSRAGYQTV